MSSPLDHLSQSPAIWNALRWVAEAGYHGEHAMIAQELQPWKDVGTRRFLDLGCGTGAHAKCFPPKQYVGLDITRAYVTYAGQHRKGSFLIGDGTAMALQENSFDAALILGVLHHLPDGVATAVMRELYRVMRPGALALIMEDIPPPQGENPAGHLIHWLDRGGHIRSEGQYRTLFGEGFQLLRSTRIRSGICDYAVSVLQRRSSQP